MKYKCEICGGDYEDCDYWTEEKINAESEIIFGEKIREDDEMIVCGDCFNEFVSKCSDIIFDKDFKLYK